MRSTTKQSLKELLGHLPLTAELHWLLRGQGLPAGGYSLERLDAHLAEWQTVAANSPHRADGGRKVLLFGMLRYWVEHTALLGMALAGLGHEATLAYSPYVDWHKPITDKFTFRKHALYCRHVLRKAEPLMETFSLLDQASARALPAELAEQIESLSVRDAQYHLQREQIDRQGELFTLRLARNTAVALAALDWMEAHQPDVVIIPNGIIFEFGAVYQTARYLGIPTVTYEFGEQRQRVWISQAEPVMLQQTDELWATSKDLPFTDEQMERVKALFSARQGADLWANFYRRWQNAPAEGESRVRTQLGLDDRPVVLLAANVIGDSLTLGRQVFTDNMTEWLLRTLEYFATRQDVQFILRVHPGEQNLDGPSVVDLVNEALPQTPDHIHVIAASDAINTYDLVAIADLGLAYTTTVGMEMAMNAVPVIVVGDTHYRGKGFTLDPQSWDEYFDLLEKTLAAPEKLRPSEEQIRRAWHYAYRFFFDYPHPFPWHLLHFWKDVETWPLYKVLSPEGYSQYADTFAYLVVQPTDWRTRVS